MRKIDLTGQRFGKLVAIKPVNSKPRRKWMCRCDCGGKTYVPTAQLINGNTKSCGCENPFKYKHGYAGTKLETKYYDMKRRCYSPKSQNYKYYGLRGISVCKEWKNNPSSFYEWAVNNGYRENLELDRIDVDGNYCPKNCRFVTRKENVLNRRNVINSISKKARDRQLIPNTVYSRIRRGWSLERSLNTEV